MFAICPRNWITPFKLSKLLVTLDGGKLSRVGAQNFHKAGRVTLLLG